MVERPRMPTDPMKAIYQLEHIGKVAYHPNMYSGNPDLIGKLAELAETPEFLAQYPDHHVFAIDEDIIVATPQEANNLEECEAGIAARRRVLDERGVSEWNCAVIQTGRRKEIKLAGGITLSSFP